MLLFYLKAFHIIGFVAWFSGLFYLVRMFVYHKEASEKSEPERSILRTQFSLMQQRVFSIIATPAMVFTFICGAGMLLYNPAYLQMGWMHIKLTLLIVLFAYHIYCYTIMKKMETGTHTFTSFQFRLLNEVPSLFLFAIVLLAVLKNNLHIGYAALGIFSLGILFFIAAKLYKRKREG